MRRCPKCQQNKPEATDWYTTNRTACKQCIRERRRARYAANKDRDRAYMAQYRDANRERIHATQAKYRVANADKIRAYHAKHNWRYRSERRARERNAHRVERFDRAEIIERDGQRCHLCGKRVPLKDIHLDHLVPLSKGGAHAPDNIAVAHSTCNLRRHAGKTPAQLRLIG